MRRADRPDRLTNRVVIARWVEAETLQLKRLGMGYQAIADRIGGVARGQQNAVAPLPSELQFPDGYRISTQAVHRAFKRAIVRLPNAEAAELRKLDSERLDEMLLSLQLGIRKGDPRSIEVAVKLLTHKAELNGYKEPTRLKVTGTQVNVLVDERSGESQSMVDLNRLTLDELREYRRLEGKARGIPEVIEIESVKMAADIEDVEPRPTTHIEEDRNGHSN
jgi:hypothetical protein